jgi:hypothetical protein
MKMSKAGEASGEATQADAKFAAWLRDLRFVIEAGELDRARSAFERLAAMNQMNRTSSSFSSRRGPGVDA